MIKKILCGFNDFYNLSFLFDHDLISFKYSYFSLFKKLLNSLVYTVFSGFNCSFYFIFVSFSNFKNICSKFFLNSCSYDILSFNFKDRFFFFDCYSCDFLINFDFFLNYIKLNGFFPCESVIHSFIHVFLLNHSNLSSFLNFKKVLLGYKRFFYSYI